MFKLVYNRNGYRDHLVHHFLNEELHTNPRNFAWHSVEI